MEELFDIEYCQPNAPHFKICERTIEDVIDFFFEGWNASSVHEAIASGNWRLFVSGTDIPAEVA